MFFLCGLGNPGEKYKSTFHNLGYLVMDKIASRYEVDFKKRICNSRIANFSFFVDDKIEKKLCLIKPYTYMNLSGKAIVCLKKKYNFVEQNLLVICDDINLDKGYVRIKTSGSSGGHKGLDSIITSLGSKEFLRLRVGIGPLDEKDTSEAYVLRGLSKKGIRDYDLITEKVVEIVECYLNYGIDKAMALYNRKKLI